MKIDGMALDKPAHGAPECNRCGYCCLKSICPLGAMVKTGRLDAGFEDHPGPCPYVERGEDGRFGCGLVLHPKRHHLSRRSAADLSAAALNLIGSGVGCDAQAYWEPENTAYRRALRARARPGVVAAMRTWGF